MATTRAPKTARTYTDAGKAARAAKAAARKASATVTAPTSATPAQAMAALGLPMGPTLLALPAPCAANRPAPACSIGTVNNGVEFGPYYVPTAATAVAPATPSVGKLPNGLPALVPAAVTAKAASHIAYLRTYGAKNAGTGTGWQHLPTLTDGYLAAVVANCPTERAARRRMRAWLAPVAAKHGGPQPGNSVVA